MKERATRISLLLSAFIILLAFNIDEVLVRFLLAGEIPGTDTSLPPTVMLSLFAGIILIPLASLILRNRMNSLSRKLDQAKARFPKRRYSSLS